MDEKSTARLDELEAALWRSGYQGTAEELDTVLEALAAWLQVLMGADREQRIAEARNAAEEYVREFEAEHGPISQAAYAEAEQALREISPDPQPVDLAMLARMHSTQSADPYGAALLDAIEEAVAEADGEVTEYPGQFVGILESLAGEVQAAPDMILRGTADGYPRPCKTCGEPKQRDEFKIDKAMRGGRRSDCKKCVRGKDRAREERKAKEA